MARKKKTTKEPPSRRLRRLSPVQADGSGRIRITVAGDAEDYDLQTFAAYGGSATGVTLTKTSDGKVRHVMLVDSLEECTCDCEYGTYCSDVKPCKHITALRAMAHKGWLPLPVEEYLSAQAE